MADLLRPVLCQAFGLFAVLLFAQRALAAAEIFALAAALIRRFGFCTGPTFDFVRLTFAQRALAAREIFRLAAALILRRFLGATSAACFIGEPRIRLSLFSRD